MLSTLLRLLAASSDNCMPSRVTGSSTSRGLTSMLNISTPAVKRYAHAASRMTMATRRYFSNLEPIAGIEGTPELVLPPAQKLRIVYPHHKKRLLGAALLEE